MIFVSYTVMLVKYIRKVFALLYQTKKINHFYTTKLWLFEMYKFLAFSGTKNEYFRFSISFQEAEFLSTHRK